MAKFGKLDSSDDSDDDNIANARLKRNNESVLTRHSAKYRVILSDEDNDSSELSSAPSVPAPRNFERLKRMDTTGRETAGAGPVRPPLIGSQSRNAQHSKQDRMMVSDNSPTGTPSHGSTTTYQGSPELIHANSRTSKSHTNGTPPGSSFLSQANASPSNSVPSRKQYTGSRLAEDSSTPIASPSRSVYEPLATPTPRASPLKVKFHVTPQVSAGSPSGRPSMMLSYSTSRRANISSESSQVQDLLTALAASTSFQGATASSSSRTSTQGPSRGLESSSSPRQTPLLVRLKRPSHSSSAPSSSIPAGSQGSSSLSQREDAPSSRFTTPHTDSDAPRSPQFDNIEHPSTSPTPSSPLDLAPSILAESFISKATHAQWTPLAQRRADLANAQVISGSKDTAIVISDSEDDIEVQIVSGTDGGIVLQDAIANWPDETSAGEENNETYSLGVEKNLNVALKVRSLVDRVWTKFWGATPVGSPTKSQSLDLEESGMDNRNLEGHNSERDPTGSMDIDSSFRAVKGNPTPPPKTISSSGFEAKVPFTPTTVISTAPTLVNDQPAFRPAAIPIVPASTSPVPAASSSSLQKGMFFTTEEFEHSTQTMRLDQGFADSHLDDPFFAFLKSSTSAPDPTSSINFEVDEKGTVTRILHRPIKRFVGVKVPRIGIQCTDFPLKYRQGVEKYDSAELNPNDLDWNEISDSELSGSALDSYIAVRYDQEQRKRKANRSSVSSFDEDTDDYRNPGKSASRKSSKRRKVSEDPATGRIVSRPLSLAAPRQISTAGDRIDVPFGICVDDIDPTTIRIRSVKDALVATTRLCHQCRNSGSSEMFRAQCGNTSTTSDGDTHQCNKTFCERCLRGWYGFDDHAMEFLKGSETDDTLGSGLGLRIKTGSWICPVCIHHCMCTVCSRKRQVPRTKYRPSRTAIISIPLVERRTKSTGSRKRPRSPSDGELNSSSTKPTKIVRFATSRLVPTAPAGWLPLIPTPTAGLDSIYYEATRPCTRDFPTGAPLPTAANHAPILYQSGAALEDDGLEDAFTGSESDEHVDESQSSSNNGTAPVKDVAIQQALPAPKKRRNFMIVAPGEKLPNTTKKRRPPLVEPAHLRHAVVPASSSIATASGRSFEETQERFESLLVLAPATVDPLDVLGDSYHDDISTSSILRATQELPYPSQATSPAFAINTGITGDMEGPSLSSSSPFEDFAPSSAYESLDTISSTNELDANSLEPMDLLSHPDAWPFVDAEGDLVMDHYDSHLAYLQSSVEDHQSPSLDLLDIENFLV